MSTFSRAASFGSVAVKTPPALPGMRIGIMGGSFNPPHEGHAIVARTALKRLDLDFVWWLMTPGNPLKSHDGLAPLNARMAAARALVPEPRMVMTAFEAELGTPFTEATLAFVRRRHPATHFVWIMGADNLASFHRWQNWRGIAAVMPFAVVDRPGWQLAALSAPAARALAKHRIPESSARLLATATPPAWTFLTTRLSPLSSTELRARSAT